MSFESGSITFRMFYMPQPMPRNAVERFAARAAPSLDALGSAPIRGWVTGRHLLDNRIEKATAYVAGHLRLTLMKAERKIPEALLRAECRMEELARLQAEGKAELDRKTRSDIRKEISERLLPTMPPQLKGMAFVHPANTDLVYAEAVSDQQMDALEASVRETLGFGLVPVAPPYAALRRLNVDVRDVPATSFSPDCEDAAVENNVGQDFLTWLWFFSEVRGGFARLGDAGEFAVMIEGPLTFVMEGQGAHETVLRRGTPALSAEAKIALLSGKKLKRARLVLARGQDQWQVAVDADTFVFRGLKLPETEKLEPIGRFEDRMQSVGVFRDAFLALYDWFIKARMEPAVWAKTQKEIHRWVSERTARR